MTWAALVGAILSFLAPVVRQWLADLLRRADERLVGPGPVGVAAAQTPGDHVRAVFAAAREGLHWWNWRKRRVLRACERHALVHADELTAAACGGPRVQMAPAVVESVAKLF